MLSEKKGETITEFINMWRTRTAPSWERQRTPLARRGMQMSYTDDTEQTSTNVKAMPIDMEYSVWFWSKDKDVLNDIAEEYLFWQQDNPNLSLYYNDVYPADFDLHFGEIVDESDVPSMMNKGNHFCIKVPIKMDGWVFTSTTDNAVIQKIELVLYDNENLEDYRECIYEADEYDADVAEALKLGEQHIYGILDVTISTKTFMVNRDNADEFVAGEKIYLNDSTGNDGIYTIVSSADGTVNTTVVVLEDIPDSTVDGYLTLRNID